MAREIILNAAIKPARKLGDPTREEMIRFINSAFLLNYPVGEFSSANFDEDSLSTAFDVESAIFWFGNDWHSGQSSNLYSAMSCSEYRPSPMCNGIHDEDETAQEIYTALESHFCL